jgi:hypothetical protein
MDDKHRLDGFKALLTSEQANAFYLEDHDGEYRLWSDLSAQGKLEVIARDAAYYDIAFEDFADSVRESVDAAAIEDAALRLVMRSQRELHDVEKLFPDDGGTEPLSPLVERIREVFNQAAPGRVEEVWLTPEEQAELFQEIRADEAAAKREDAHWYPQMSLQQLRDEKPKSPPAEKGYDRGNER